MRELRQKTIAEGDYTPQDEGWDSRLKSKRLMDNPYAVNNWKHYEWEKGWHLADNNNEKI